MPHVHAHARGVGIGQQLAVVREVAFQAAVDEYGVMVRDDDLVLSQRQLEVVLRARQRRYLLQERSRDDRLELLGAGFGKLGFGDGKAIRVGGHHLERGVLERDQHAREDGAALVLRHHARHALHHGSELREGNGHFLLHVHVRESGEVLRVERLDGERRRVARDDRRVVLGCHVHGCVGQVLHDLGEQLAGNHGLARLLDERRNRVLDGQLEVGRLKRKGVVVRVEVDARQNGKRRSGCDALEHHGQRVLQFRLVDAEFQDVPFL